MIRMIWRQETYKTKWKRRWYTDEDYEPRWGLIGTWVLVKWLMSECLNDWNSCSNQIKFRRIFVQLQALSWRASLKISEINKRKKMDDNKWSSPPFLGRLEMLFINSSFWNSPSKRSFTGNLKPVSVVSTFWMSKRLPILKRKVQSKMGNQMRGFICCLPITMLLYNAFFYYYHPNQRAD